MKQAFAILCLFALSRVCLAGDIEIKGRILAADGKTAAEGVSVKGQKMGRFYDDEADAFQVSVKSGKDGAFCMNIPPAPEKKSFEVYLEDKEGHIFEGFAHVDKSQNLGDLVLKRGCDLAGKVIGPDGKPAPKVALKAEIRLNTKTCHHYLPAAKVESDADGKFLFKNLSPREYRLSASGNTLTSDEKEIKLGEDLNYIEITVEEGGSVEGQVQGPDGKPVAGAELCLSHGQKGKCISDKDGKYQFGGLKREKICIQAKAKGLGLASNRPVEVQPFPGKTVYKDIYLVETGVLKLRVIIEGGKPEELPKKIGIRLDVEGKGGYHGLSSEIKEGFALFPEIVPGTYTLKLSEDDYPQVEMLVVIKSGCENAATLLLQKGLSLSGKVIAEYGVAVEGADIEFYALKNGERDYGSTKRSESDAAGRFEIKAMSKGQFLAEISHDDMETLKQKIELSTGAGERIFTLKRGLSVSGNVADESGSLLSGLRVSLDPIGRGSSKSAETDAKGEFSFKGVSAGQAELKIDDDERIPFKKNITITGNLRLSETIVLQKGLAISGRVIDEAGKAVSDARVSLQSEGPDGWKHGETDQAGSFELKGIKAGKKRLSIEHKDRMTFKQALQVTENRRIEEPFVLKSGFSIRGKIADSSGKPVTEGQVQGSGVRTSFYKHAELDDSGAFSLGGLPEGKMRVQFTHEQYMPFSKEFEVRGDLELGTITLAEGHSLKGSVSGADGKSVLGLRVSAYGPTDSRGPDAASVSRQVETGQDGRFELKGLPEGRFQLQVNEKRGNRELHSIKDLMVPADDLIIVLGRDHEVSGTVQDEEGKAVEGAVISISRRDADSGMMTPLYGRESRTDEKGAFSIKLLEGAQYALKFTRHPFVPAREAVDLRGGGLPAPLRITMKTGYSVSGVVVREGSGEPVAGVQVSAAGSESYAYIEMDTSDDGQKQDGSRAPTDKDGRFTLGGLKAGIVTLQVVREKDERTSVVASRQIEVKPGEEREVRISIPASGAVLAQVLDKEGAPKEGAQVSLVPANGRDMEYMFELHRESDDKGEALFEEVAAGEYMAMCHDNFGAQMEDNAEDDTAMAMAMMPKIKQVSVKAGETAKVTIGGKEAEQSEITGLALDSSGQPFAGGMIHFMPLKGGGGSEQELMLNLFTQARQAKIGMDGTFRVKGLSSGKNIYRISRMPGEENAEEMDSGITGTVDISEGQTSLTIEIRGLRFGGSVVEADGRPAADAMVALSADSPEEKNFLFEEMLNRGAKTDEKGGFVFQALQPGVYTLSVQHEKGIFSQKGIRIEADIADFVAKLAAGFKLKGEVRGSSGEPASGCSLCAVGKDNEPQGYGSTGEDGRYEIGFLTAGDYSVLATLAGHEVGVKRVNLDRDANLDFSLKTGGSIEVVLKSVSPEKLKSRKITLKHSSGEEVFRLRASQFAIGFAMGSEAFSLRNTGKDGRVVIEGLAPGKYSVSVEGASATAQAEVKALEKTVVELNAD